MITLNALAQRCLDLTVKTFRLGEHSGKKGYSIRISYAWRMFDSASRHKDKEFTDYSEQEVWAAKMIIYLVAWLKKFGCKDIERLIKDVIEKGDK